MLTVIADALIVAARQDRGPMSPPRRRVAEPSDARARWRFVGKL